MKDVLEPAPALRAALVGIVDRLSACTGPWAIYGGAALHLHGFDDGPLGDIDILMTLEDAEAMAEQAGIASKIVPPSGLFRSREFLCTEIAGMAVEFMAGLEVCRHGQWWPVEVRSVERVAVGEAGVCVASRAELIRIFRLIGREKDMRRAAMLESTD